MHAQLGRDRFSGPIAKLLERASLSSHSACMWTCRYSVLKSLRSFDVVCLYITSSRIRDAQPSLSHDPSMRASKCLAGIGAATDNISLPRSRTIELTRLTRQKSFAPDSSLRSIATHTATYTQDRAASTGNRSYGRQVPKSRYTTSSRQAYATSEHWLTVTSQMTLMLVCPIISRLLLSLSLTRSTRPNRRPNLPQRRALRLPRTRARRLG